VQHSVLNVLIKTQATIDSPKYNKAQ